MMIKTHKHVDELSEGRKRFRRRCPKVMRKAVGAPLLSPLDHRSKGLIAIFGKNGSLNLFEKRTIT